MRGAPAWQKPRSVQHPSSVSALRADPPPGASDGPRPPFGPHKGRRQDRAFTATVANSGRRRKRFGSPFSPLWEKGAERSEVG
ncbi:MAG: hypothetical protein E5Y79_26190 [Mesorhizobium sp.]|nr:MAG: hypothetical protein E5Y79_26190 [Mesorhizobium sp.]